MELFSQSYIGGLHPLLSSTWRYLLDAALPVMLIEMLALVFFRWGTWRQVASATLLATVVPNFFCFVVAALLGADDALINHPVCWFFFLVLHAEVLRKLNEKNGYARVVVSVLVATLASLMAGASTLASLLITIPVLAGLVLFVLPFACLKAISLRLCKWDTFERCFWSSALTSLLSTAVACHYALKGLSGNLSMVIFLAFFVSGELLVMSALKRQQAGWRLIMNCSVATATAALSFLLLFMFVSSFSGNHNQLSSWIGLQIAVLLAPFIATALTAVGWSSFARSYRDTLLVALFLALLCPCISVPSECLMAGQGLRDPLIWLSTFAGSGIIISVLRIHSLRFIWFVAMFVSGIFLCGDSAVTPQVIAPPFIMIFASMLPGFLADLASTRLKDGDFDQAERYFNHACALERLIGPQPALAAASGQGIGDIHMQRSQWLQAEQNYKAALALVREEIGDSDGLIGSLLVRLHLICNLQNRCAEASNMEALLQAYQRDYAFGQALPEGPQIASMSAHEWRSTQWHKSEDCLFGVSWRLAGAKLVATFLCPALLACSAWLDSIADSDKVTISKEVLYRQSLAIQELVAGEGAEAAFGHERLAQLYKTRGDQLMGINELKRALSIRERLLSVSPAKTMIDPPALVVTRKRLVFLLMQAGKNDDEVIENLRSIVAYHRRLESAPRDLLMQPPQAANSNLLSRGTSAEHTAFYTLVLGVVLGRSGSAIEARSVLSSAYSFYRENRNLADIPATEEEFTSRSDPLFQARNTGFIKCANQYEKVLIATNRRDEAQAVRKECYPKSNGRLFPGVYSPVIHEPQYSPSAGETDFSNEGDWTPDSWTTEIGPHRSPLPFARNVN